MRILKKVQSVWKLPKVSHPPIFVKLKSGNAVWPQASGSEKLARLTIFGIFVNVARFARNVKRDFFCDFQTLWNMMIGLDLRTFLDWDCRDQWSGNSFGYGWKTEKRHWRAFWDSLWIRFSLQKLANGKTNSLCHNR